MKVGEVAERYYSTIVGAIKEQDPNHLILSDRYNGNKGIPEAVLHAMSKYVDVLSIQYFVEAPTPVVIKDPYDEPYTELTNQMSAFNNSAKDKWLQR
ncbi:hypothetical protein N7474_009940 [Penicillium riverlandense]|uniref:uncharacterized protein n=1 Tax=Penicillium riverlandense TaxID=1903569 RepID=UPI0025480FDD|nr:uncharacterized protein N7474_009940 [Penicillium riverlandense]KAJ5808671.1 hypothetical protein N7474_009940 [Penicillium riverlandense]